MKEDDIRPFKLRKQEEKLFEEDAKEFLRYAKRFIDVDCPACGKSNKKVSFRKKGYVFKRCDTCRTYYISPRPTPELLKIYYSSSKSAKFWQEKIFPLSRDARMKTIYKPRADLILDIVLKNNIGRELLVDVGAGSGFFGQEAVSRNFFKKVILIEPGPIKIKSSSSVEVINDFIENTNLNLSPDIVTNFELIEHLSSPLEFLKKVYVLMRRGSYFIFTTPNMEGFELITLFNRSINIAGPNHLNYFNTSSIRLLLERIGFKDIQVSTPGRLDADIVANKHKEGVIDLKKYPFLYYMLIQRGDELKEQFQEFLRCNNLSSNMMVVCRK
ncbi:MAG: class I SAM-dependent methyltransferase [Candidatus Omnitrophica bacterium]|nr:class I SAM-dependent methyltransferase [Candidatus Omnitrophota bacterium]